MKKFLARTLLLLAFAPLVTFAESAGRVERDLGLGLAYLRIHALPADLPSAPAKPVATVVDLRYTRSDASAVVALGAWIRFRASVRTPLFVLVNASSAPAILDFFETAAPIPGLVTLGAPSSRFVPDVPLKLANDAERHAYDALEHGASVESLVTDNPTKARHDEASIAQEHALAPLDDDDADGTLSDSAEEAPLKAPAVAPLIDPALQRAIQLHRALLALRKL
ncbi:MAG: hypothetical protein JWM32_1415 [Verrucomicrobia bacterium]|nr:hypothetical protein [Verrucomicrobiota bacterium]